MTIDQLNKLTDEEVRARVSERLGWKRVMRKKYAGDFNVWVWERKSESHSGKDTILYPGQFLKYESDLNSAFTLVEKLRAESWRVDVIFSCLHDQVFVQLQRPDNQRPSITTVDKDPARAICLAFLAVTEREEG